jgi:hypothetical protein
MNTTDTLIVEASIAGLACAASLQKKASLPDARERSIEGVPVPHGRLYKRRLFLPEYTYPSAFFLSLYILNPQKSAFLQL